MCWLFLRSITIRWFYETTQLCRPPWVKSWASTRHTSQKLQTSTSLIQTWAVWRRHRLVFMILPAARTCAKAKPVPGMLLAIPTHHTKLLTKLWHCYTLQKFWFWEAQYSHKNILKTEMLTFGFIPSRIIFASSADGKFSPRLRLNHKTLDKHPIMMFGFKCFNTWKLKYSIKKN